MTENTNLPKPIKPEKKPIDKTARPRSLNDMTTQEIRALKYSVLNNIIESEEKEDDSADYNWGELIDKDN